MKRKLAKLEPISEMLFEQKKSTILSTTHSEATGDNQYYCAVSKKVFKSEEQYNQHIKSKKYKKNLAKQ